MTDTEFYKTVAAMRDNQRKYFSLRSGIYLQEAKRLERIVDAEIARRTPKKEESTLF